MVVVVVVAVCVCVWHIKMVLASILYISFNCNRNYDVLIKNHQR